MDLVNAVLTFGPASLIVYSLGKRLIMAGRARSAPRRRVSTPRRSRPALPTHVMFRLAEPSALSWENNREQHSYAAERDREQPGTAYGNSVPALREQVGTLSDDALLAELALVLNDDGSFKYAESRIAKFIGGRTEDRIAQVRAVRGVETAPKIALPKNFPQRTPEQEMLRMQLGLKQKGALK